MGLAYAFSHPDLSLLFLLRERRKARPEGEARAYSWGYLSSLVDWTFGRSSIPYLKGCYLTQMYLKQRGSNMIRSRPRTHKLPSYLSLGFFSFSVKRDGVLRPVDSFVEEGCSTYGCWAFLLNVNQHQMVDGATSLFIILS